MSDDAKTAANNRQAYYSGDYPIQNLSEDKFNRWPFAKRIADTLRDREDPACIVLGIYGAWGEGKTSVLNLIEAELKKCEKVAVVRFNPWYFSSEAVLIKGLFETLAEGVGRKLANGREQLGDALGKLGTFLSLASLSMAGGAVSVNPGEAVSKLGSALSQAELADYRKRVQEILRQEGLRVVVLIDDIDRLERQEIQALFKTVRLSADFERVTYILSFDHDVVADSLGERYGSGGAAQGAAFLEKIVQVPLHLPPARKGALRQLVFAGAEAAVTVAGIDLSRESARRVATEYVNGLEPRMATPRQAQLYANALLFALPLLKGEVNVIDQMLIEGTRVLYPRLYETIRGNAQLFIFMKTSFEEGKRRERIKAILDGATYIESPEQREGIEALLHFLFPKTSDEGYSSDWESIWAREQRICSAEYFSRYFSYAIGESEVSDVEFDDALRRLEASQDESEAAAIWQDLISGGSRSEEIIEKIVSRADDPKGPLAQKLLDVIPPAGALYPREAEEALFSLPAFTRAAALVGNLVMRLKKDERVAAAGRSLDRAEPLAFAVELVQWLHVFAEEEEDKKFEREDLKKLGGRLAERISERARREWLGGFGKTVPLLLGFWKEYGQDEKEVRSYVTVGLEEDRSRLPQLLRCFASERHSISKDMPLHPMLREGGYEKLSEFIDPEFIEHKIKEMYGDRLQPGRISFKDNDTPWEFVVCNQFVTVHDALKKLAQEEGMPADFRGEGEE